MTAVATAKEPCWVLSHEIGNEWVSHYSSEADALHELAKDWNEAIDDAAAHRVPIAWQHERPDLVDSKPDRFSENPCVELVCDGCDLAEGQEGELVDPGSGAHFDPAEIEHFLSLVEEWTVDRETGHDYCPDCPPPPESEEDARRRPGPDDVPLPLEVPC